MLARSTLADALRRDALPRADVVVALVRACGAEEDVAAWLAARERLAERERRAGEDPSGVSGTAAADRAPKGGAVAESRSRTASLIVLASLGTVVLLVVAVILLPRDDGADGSRGGDADASLGAAATPVAAGPAPGWSRIRPLRAPTLCLTEGQARVEDETKAVAVQRPCAEAVPPRTYLQRESDGLYLIRWEHPEHGPGCLTVLDGGLFQGMLEPWPWKACQGGSGAQRFRVDRAPDGGRDHWRIRPAQDAGRVCVGIRGGSAEAHEAGAVAVAQRCDPQGADEGQVFVIGPE